MSTIVKSLQNMSFLSKDNIIIKHNKHIRISFIDLSPFIHSQFGFIDPDFPHASSSINQNQQMNYEETQWLPAENIHEYANYSDLITNLQVELFHKKSIGHALTIINWFANVYFGDIFIQDISSYHLYSYDVMIDGIFINIPIDSYVPIYSKSRKEMFSKNYKGSIFPCLYEKLLAKIYGDYESITADFMDIVELQTLFCRQEISLTLGIQQKFLIETIKQSLQAKSIVSFKTRNSIRLESFGLQSNSIYIILRLIPKDETYLVQFLQLQGERWIGKYSKLRSEWLMNKQYISKHKIVNSGQFKQNYMLLSDMKGLGRELTILHNTFEYHKNYYSCQNNQYNLTGYNFNLKQKNKLKIRINYRHKKCYNSIFIINRNRVIQNTEGFKLICSSFNENKDNNFEQLQMQSGQYTIIIYNTHPQGEVLPYNITLFTSQQFIQLLPINSISQVVYIFQGIFKQYFIQQSQHNKQQIICKQLYNDTGLSFIFINRPSNKLNIEINMNLLRENKIYLLNYSNISKQNQIKLQIEKDQYMLLIMKCLWSKKQNIIFDYEAIDSKQHIQKIVFPPLGSIKVYQKRIK